MRVQRPTTIIALLIVMFGVNLHHITPTFAQSARDLAKARYAAGRNAFNIQNYPEALKAFHEAYQLFPLPLMLYNIGSVYDRMNQPFKAIEYLEKFIQTGQDQGDEARAQLNILQKKVHTLSKLSRTSRNLT